MAEKTPPPPVGSLTDSEGGEGRHLVQWLRGSLSTERGARKAAQRSVSSLEARIASLERQLQNQRPAKSRLRKSSSGEPEDLPPGADGLRTRGEEGADRRSSGTQYERRSRQKSPGRSKRTRELEGMSLESAAWAAWQTFSAEMARIADAREARQSALERKVDSLAQQFESLLPHAAAAASSARGSPSTSWEAASIPRDYHDVPGNSKGSREELASSGNWKLSIPGPSLSENFLQKGESENPPGGGPNVESLAIWGGFSPAGSRPPKDVDPDGGTRPAATHLRTSSEGDAQLLTLTGESTRSVTASKEPVLTSAGRPAADAEGDTRPRDYTSAAESNTGARYTGLERLTSADVSIDATREAAGTRFGMQHSVLYSPLEDDTIWQSIMGGPLEEPVGVKDLGEVEVADQSVAQALAKMRGHLDRRMLGFDRSGGEPSFETGAEFDDETGGDRFETRPYSVTLPATPLHEGTPLWSQFSRSTSGGSLDFQ